MQSPFQRNGREFAVAFSGAAVFKLQVHVGGPLDVVFLVDRNVVAVALEVCYGRSLLFYVGVVVHNGVLAELRLVYHDVDEAAAFAIFYGNLDKKVMVAVPYKWNFHVFPFQLLLDFFFSVDGVLEESAALDFPAGVDPPTGAKASGAYAQTGTDA